MWTNFCHCWQKSFVAVSFACCFDSERAFTGMYELADSNSLWERKAIRVHGKKIIRVN